MPEQQPTPPHVFSFVSAAAPGVATVECRGPLTLEYAQRFKEEVKRLIGVNQRVVLDLTGVSRMDSSGLGTIVSLYVSARSRNCRLEVINLNQRVRELFALSNLFAIFETCGRDGIRIP
jgi:anti-anti-sigma factor